MAKFKRYDSYKNSGVEWLREIPSHWEILKTKYVHKNIKFLNTNRICDNVLSLTLRGVVNNNIDNPEGLVPKDYAAYQIFEKDDLVFKLIDLENISTSRVGIVHEKGIMSSAYIRLKIGKISIPKFAYYYYYFLYINNVYNNIGCGVRSTLNPTDLLNIKFPLPPKDEQEKIASYLDEKIAKIDASISGKEKFIELLKEQKQIIINDAVTKGLNKNAKFKNSGVEWLGQIPSHWDVKRFKDYFKFDKGLTITKENLQDEGIFCVNYGEIHSKLGFEVNPKIDNLKCVGKEYLKANQKSLVKNGDFIFADTSEDIEGAGNFTYLNSCLPTFAGYHTIICRHKKNLASRYLAYEFQSTTFRSQIQKRVKGVKVYSITQGLLADLIIWLPPKEEQEKIVSYLDEKISKIDKLINLEQEYIKSLKEYKASLIDSIVTGKVRII